MNINLEYYKIFYYVAKLGSITNAAKELHISQPAVSQGIKQLEESLGIQVFMRKAKGVNLTTEGEILFSYVRDGYEKILQGESALKEILNLETGEIRIGASDMTLEYYLLPYLEEFHKRFPNIKVSVTNAPTPLTIEHLMAGRIDFGVVSTPFAAKERLNIFEGRRIQDIFVCGERFKDLTKQVMTYRKLLDFPVICLEKNTSTRRYVDSFLKKNEVVLQPEFELATSSIVTQFAVRNLGIGCVVRDFAKKDIEEGRLFELKFDYEIPQRSICVITDSHVPLSSAAKELMAILNKE